jgi:hypothetical protein
MDQVLKFSHPSHHRGFQGIEFPSFEFEPMRHPSKFRFQCFGSPVPFRDFLKYAGAFP